MLKLSATQSVTLQLQASSLLVAQYLRQPERLMRALVHADQIQPLGNNTFRLCLRALQFFMLRVQPVVDLAVQMGGGDRLTLHSTGCEIRGNAFINQRFTLSLQGYLQPRAGDGYTYLEGRADLTIIVELPTVLQFTPRTLLEVTGNQLLKSILLTMKQRLMHRLGEDYRRWYGEQVLVSSPISITGSPSGSL